MAFNRNVPSEPVYPTILWSISHCSSEYLTILSHFSPLYKLLGQRVEETEDHKPEYIDNIDQAIGEGRRTLVFEDLKLPEVPKVDLISHSGSNEDNKNLPTIVRKNVKPLKRRMSKIEVSEIIKSENPIVDLKKQLYGDESPILKEIRKDAIHEENEGKD